MKAAQSVFKLLLLMLECMAKEFFWFEGIRYILSWGLNYCYSTVNYIILASTLDVYDGQENKPLLSHTLPS